MLTLEKSHGLTRVGGREKRILLLMLKGDEPPGKPNPIWFDIYREFGMDYCSFPKKYQQKFREERSFRLSIHRLTKKGFVRPVSVVPNGHPLPDPRGYGYVFYCLTQRGRTLAEELQWEEHASESQEDLKKLLKQLSKLSNEQKTISQIRELLWQQSHNKFECREAFENYWSQRRLGLVLKKLGYKNARVSLRNRQKKYSFDDIPDNR